MLEAFHRHVKAEHGEWRKLPAADAVALVEQIARDQLPQYEHGKFLADGAARFTGEVLVTRLKLLMAALYAWLPQYDFNPAAAELAFNGDPGQLPAWQLALPDGHTLILRGRIDRVDLFQLDAQTALAVVLDYKSSPRKLDATRLHHGLELQLLSYLGVLQNLTSPEEIFAVKKIIPAGVFFIPLNGGNQPKSSRAQIAYRRQTDLAAYQHNGRFLADELRHFDNRGQRSGDQFKYSILKSGELGKRGNEALPQAEFTALTE